MSRRIVVLSTEISNKIAAGEVVERPASIVKELVENSIDAGAENISVELEKGGCQSIRVTDDGEGIEKEDVALAFARHATSKIHKFEDVCNVASFGFRGEAMPSIASVAKVELLTRRESEWEGTKAVVEAGAVKEMNPVGCPVGTQISVSNIFTNIPARKKFLKKEATEQSFCLDAIIRLALAYPEIRFRLSANGKEIFAVPKTKDLEKRVAAVMGMNFSASCIQIEGEKENVKIFGFISHPEFTRSNSKNIYLFVNRRFVRDNSLIHAILSAYRQIIPPRRYPAGVLFIEIPPSDVDVNVHPAKLEVRFRDVRCVYDLVSQTITQQLAHAASTKGSFVYRLTPKTEEVTEGLQSREQKYSAKDASLFSQNIIKPPVFNNYLPNQALKNATSAGVVPEYKEPHVTFTGMNYLGQFAGTYLVFSDEKDLLLIDQHVAHERIILEKFKKSSSSDKIISQRLLMPEIVSVPPDQITLFADHVDMLREVGLDLEVFGRDTLAIKALPAILSAAQAKEVVADIADTLKDQSQNFPVQEKKEEIYAAFACRAAIKANKILSIEEVSALCRDLEETPFNATCPHGRPISVKLSLGEIERMFKRK